MRKGVFVVFEGVDGAGTSTQLIELIKHIETKDKYQDVLRTHEPWKSAEIKRRLKEEKDAYLGADKMAWLFVDDRIRHSVDLILPNLEKGVCVLCDRYEMSTCAYQWTQGADLSKLLEMHKDERILTPDLTIFVDVYPDIAERRLLLRGDHKEKFEDQYFQKNLIDSYHDLIKIGEEDINLFGLIAKVDGNDSIKVISDKISDIFDKAYSKWQEL